MIALSLIMFCLDGLDIHTETRGGIGIRLMHGTAKPNQPLNGAFGSDNVHAQASASDLTGAC